MTDQTQPVAQTAPLELSDIQNALSIIDYACEHGAFKGWEVIEKVLTARQRLNAFLTAANAVADAAASAEAPAPAPDPDAPQA